VFVSHRLASASIFFTVAPRRPDVGFVDENQRSPGQAVVAESSSPSRAHPVTRRLLTRSDRPTADSGHSGYDALIGTEVEYFRKPGLRPGPRGRGDAIRRGGGSDDWPTGRGQGRQLDSRLRRLIEDPAQHRLMEHFSRRRQGRHRHEAPPPVRRRGNQGWQEGLPEAKGTLSRGESVILTRNELQHARGPIVTVRDVFVHEHRGSLSGPTQRVALKKRRTPPRHRRAHARRGEAVPMS